jgi:hypothetical protein
MNTKKITKDQEDEVLKLYYNGFVNMEKISLIVKCSVPTVSRIIGDSFGNGIKYSENYLILESKINYANNN